jgi:hypothetical protein
MHGTLVSIMVQRNKVKDIYSYMEGKKILR